MKDNEQIAISKVKLTDKGIKIHFAKITEKGIEQYAALFTELAMPEFYDAFEAMNGVMNDVLEITGIENRLKTVGLAVSTDKSGNLVAVVTVMLALPATGQEIPINTVIREQWSIGNPVFQNVLTGIDRIIQRTIQYLHGERAQTSLFTKDGEAEQENVVKLEQKRKEGHA